MDKAFFGHIAPRGHRLGHAHTPIFAVRYIPSGSLPITLPVELATGIDKALQSKVGTVQ